MADPEMEQAAAQSAMPAQVATPPDAGQAGGEDAPEGDGPLSHIDIDPAEEGGSIVTHHPRVPDRVKNMDEKAVKPRKHVMKNHDELVEHIKKHGKRLKP
jgi:hypothetical protein